MTKENDCPNTVAEKVRQAGLLIETMLGTDYLQKQCETIKKQDPDGIGVGRSHMSLTGRPLALIWLKAQEELIMGELTGKFKPGYASARLLSLAQDLSLLQQEKNIKTILHLLTLDTGFESGSFALSVAAAYCASGFSLEFISATLQVVTIRIKNQQNFVLCIEKNQFNDKHFQDIFSWQPPYTLALNIFTKDFFDGTTATLKSQVQGWFSKMDPKIATLVLSQGRIDTTATGLHFYRTWYSYHNPKIPESYPFPFNSND